MIQFDCLCFDKMNFDFELLNYIKYNRVKRKNSFHCHVKIDC